MSVHETVQWQHEKRGKKLSSTLSDKCPPFVMLKERGKALHPNVSCRAPLFVSVASLLKGSHFKRNVGWERDITHWCCWIFELQGKKQKQKKNPWRQSHTNVSLYMQNSLWWNEKKKKKTHLVMGWNDGTHLSEHSSVKFRRLNSNVKLSSSWYLLSKQ